MYISDSSKILRDIHKSVADTDPIDLKPADRSEALLRPEVCSLENAVDVNIDGKLFCLAYIGQRKHKDARQLCQSLNAKLPLPTSITENNHFIESFKRLGIDKKMADFSTKIVLDIRRSSKKGKVSLFSA